MKKQDLRKMIISDNLHILRQENESKTSYNIKRLKYWIKEKEVKSSTVDFCVVIFLATLLFLFS